MLTKRQDTRNESKCSSTTLIGCVRPRLREACGAAQRGSGARLTCSDSQSRPRGPRGSQSKVCIPMSHELADDPFSRIKCLSHPKVFGEGGEISFFLTDKITLPTFSADKRIDLPRFDEGARALGASTNRYISKIIKARCRSSEPGEEKKTRACCFFFFLPHPFVSSVCKFRFVTWDSSAARAASPSFSFAKS